MHPTTRKHLQQAAGYRELGMLVDANDEVERILLEDRFTREVLMERLHTCSEQAECAWLAWFFHRKVSFASNPPIPTTP
jgi:hypothetical protein